MNQTTPADRPIEIARIAASGARFSSCPRCGAEVVTPAGTGFIASCQVAGGLVLPACGSCVADEAPVLIEAVVSLNRLAQCLPKLEWRHASRCIGALDVIAQDVVDHTPPEQVKTTTGGRSEIRRAVLALITRQCFGVKELTIRDTIGAADPWSVIEALGNLIASKLKEGNADIEGWLATTFLEIAADEDPE